jgi:hypothetical protein
MAAVDVLLTHQRAELGRAEWFRGWSLALQFLVALLAAASVFFNDGGHLLALAGVGVLVLAIWLVCDNYYRRHRGAGDQARRLLLIVHGFEEEVAELGVIQTAFTASVAKLSAMAIEEYFATVAPAGAGRAAEMIDESAFFTMDTQRRSGELMLLVLFFALVTVGLAWFAFAPRLDGSVRVITARVLLAFAVFLLSSDVLGAAFAHLRAAASMEAIRYRLSAARARRYPQGDVLQAMADYNAAVEGPPLPLPGVYRRRQDDLNRSWADYKRLTGIGSRT